FDAAVSELFTTLLTGATLVLEPKEMLYPGPGLVQQMEEQAISVVTLPPSVLAVLPTAQLPALRTLVVAGEACPAAIVARWAAGRRFLNAYGPTEGSVCATIAICQDSNRTPPIGRPIDNVQVYILDTHLRPVPVGVTGELYIASPGLARGYLHLPALTAERFLPDPFSQEAGNRLYRTGDLVRYLPDGEIEYIGRQDGQVKVRGYRIEVGEIEAIITDHPAIREAVILAHTDEASTIFPDDQQQLADDKRLVAYLVARTDPAPTSAELRAYLLQHLPEYMLPSVYIQLDALPYLPNGKLDRRALPVPGEARPALGKAYVAPGTPLEQYLAATWQELLKLEAVGIHDNFFELGGDSIKAAISMNRVQERFGILVYVVALFDAPTIAQLAHYLAEQYTGVVVRLFGQESLPSSVSSAAPVRKSHEPLVDAAKVQLLRQVIAPLTRYPSEQVPRTTKNPPAVFVLSPPRSGSTLLRVMLAGHPRLFAPPELELLSFQTLGERYAAFAGRNAFWLEGLLRALMELKACDAETAHQLMATYEAQDLPTWKYYRLLQEWLGDRLLVDKTPAYALDLAILQRAEQEFQEAHYIHLVRHPRAMIHSFEEARLDQVFFRHPHSFSRRELAELIWVVCQQNIQEFLSAVPAERQYQVSFEELVRAPQQVMEGICHFLKLEYHPAMIEPYQGKRMTDGIHPLSKMIGDIKFHEHQAIDATAAELWKAEQDEYELGEVTREIAASLGYAEFSRKQIDEADVQASSSLTARTTHAGNLPLSFAQERLWFLDQWVHHPGDEQRSQRSAYNIYSNLHMEGTLHSRTLERSLNVIVQRHEVLRTTFVATDGYPEQVIAPSLQIPLPVVDLRGLPQAEQERTMALLATQEIEQPFDLSRGPLLRTTLVRLRDEEHIFLLTIHHIIADGWSIGVFNQELTSLYEAFMQGQPSPLPALPIQYADFALWQRQRLQGAVLQQQMQYWRQQLQGAPALLPLPTDRPRPTVQTFAGAAHSIILSTELTNSLKALSQDGGVTLFTTLLAAFQTLLSRWTQQDDISVGTYIAGRTDFETERLIGFFINDLVLRTDLSGDPSFRTLLQRAGQVTRDAYAHQDVPFEHIIQELQPERNPSHTPLFQVMLIYQNMPRHDLTFSGLTMHIMGLEVTRA
ncbi:MAG TPA: condensation domain-containing protein, partial [Ktedonobacteraceae bacterium]|nr:condensation domain-containing protein [Ktedonobacteraceae bacterium]